jgi:ribosomal protein S18 acetylase RimI-like enzyme
MTVRTATHSDINTIKVIAVESNMFEPDDVGFVDETVNGSIDGSLEDHHWVVSEADNAEANGAAYYAPEPFSDRMWNLYFIAVHPSWQGGGVGEALIAHIESHLRQRGPTDAQVLIVETSSTEQYARTREFYVKRGFVEEARIRRFHGPADDKVVFWKLLAPS